MTKTPQELFEIHYADQTDRPIEQVAVHRWKEQDGYDLPAMDRAYRYFLAGHKAAHEIMLDEYMSFAPTKHVTLDEFRLLYPAPTIRLSDAEFDAFTDQLNANPIADNKAVQDLLKAPRPWADPKEGE